MAKVRKMDDLRKLFPNHTVVGAKGQSVALLDERGHCCSYTFVENEDTVATERIVEINVNSVFGEGESAIDVSAEELVGSVQAQLNSAKSALEKATAENAKLEARINELTEVECKRRIKLVKDAIKSEFAENCDAYKNDADLDEHLCDDLLTDECVGKYAEMVNTDGEFIGDAKARDDVNAKCNKVVREAKKAKNNAEQKVYAWMLGNDNGGEGTPESDIKTAIDNILK